MNYQVWSTEPQSLGIFSVESTQPVHLKGYVSPSEECSGHQNEIESDKASLFDREVACLEDCLSFFCTLEALWSPRL